MSVPYQAAVSPRLFNIEVPLSGELATDVADASQALVRFDTEFGMTTVPFASVLLRSESASSSQIENLTSGARAIAEAELGERETGNAALIVSNVHAMQSALALADDISHATILQMHETLLRKHDPGITGRYRTEQVWIGHSSYSPHGAQFVPPHQDRVPAAMDDLVRFATRTDVPPLAHAAITHAQFETIHPFPDGNGRTGRALVHSMLRHSRLTRNITIPISAGLLQQQSRYYEALNHYRRGSIVPIIEAFIEAAFLAVENGRSLVTEIMTTKSIWENKLHGLRSDAAAHRIADLAVEHPVMNAELISDRLGMAAPTIYRAIEVLEKRGILQPANSKKRNRIWLVPEILSALDAFALRSMRTGGTPS